jgi:hypothetical protein
MNPDRVRDMLILPVSLLVLLGWISSLVFAFLTDEYTPLTVVTPIMLVLAGFIFGSSIVRRALRDDQ